MTGYSHCSAAARKQRNAAEIVQYVLITMVIGTVDGISARITLTAVSLAVIKRRNGKIK